MSKGFIPIVVIIVITSALISGGGGYVGVRYYQSNKLTKKANELYKQGKYKEASEIYRQAGSRWSMEKVAGKLEESTQKEVAAESYNRGLAALEQKNWSLCKDELTKVDSEFYLADDALAKTKECETNLNNEKLAQQTTQATSIPTPAPTAIAKSKTSEEKRTTPDSTPTPTSAPTVTSPDANSEASSTTNSSSSPSDSDASNNTNSSNSSGCESNKSPTFSNHITDMDKVDNIAIPPRMMGDHLKTHSYLNSDHRRMPVYAPIAAKLKGGAYVDHGGGAMDYGLDFYASCEVMFRFGHITDPVQSIKDAFGPTPQTNSMTKEITPISFAAGDLIGYTTGTTAAGNWDFGVYNSSTSNRYASDPAWNTSSIYTTAVCPYDYFSASLKSAYSSKYIQDFGVSTHDGDFFCK